MALIAYASYIPALVVVVDGWKCDHFQVICCQLAAMLGPGSVEGAWRQAAIARQAGRHSSFDYLSG